MSYSPVRSLMIVAMLLWADWSHAYTVVADYRDDFQLGTFPPGWSYLWNKLGDIDDPANYVALQTDGSNWDTDASNPGLPDTAPGSQLRLNATGGFPGSGNPDRYAIAAFQVSQSGPYAIKNSFLTLTNTTSGGSADGVIVQVKVSGGPDQIVRVVLAQSTANFDGYLGQLSAGDTIHVCVGENGNHTRDNFDLDFSNVRLATPLGQLEFPPNGDPLVGFIPNLLWQESPWGGVSSVDHYQVQIALDAAFTQLVVSGTSKIARFVPADQRLSQGITHFWRVRCVDGTSAGEWSETRQFTVADFGRNVITIGPSNSIQEVRAAFAQAKADAPATVRLTGDVSWGSETETDLIPLSVGHNHIWFDGGGHRITVNDPRNRLFHPDQCADLILTDFCVDYDPLPYSLVEVTDIDPVNQRFTVKTIRNSANPVMEINDPRMLSAERQHMRILDPANPGRVKYNRPTYLLDSRQAYHSSFLAGDGALRHVIQFTSAFHTTDMLSLGELMLRIARPVSHNIIRGSRCQDLCVANVFVFASPTQFFNSIDGTRPIVVHCGTSLVPGRYKSVTADCIFVRRNDIGPWIEDCVFQAGGDDCMHFHTFGATITEKVSDYTLRIDNVWQMKVGDSVAVWDGLPGTDTPVLSTITSVDATALTVTLANPVGTINLDNPNHEANSLIYNLTRNNQRFVVKDTVVRNGARFGLMVTSESGLIVGNTFEGCGSSAIMIGNVPGEGWTGKNIVVQSNRFESCGIVSEYFSRRHGVVTIDNFNMAWAPVSNRLHESIVVTNNDIVGWESAAFLLRSAVNVKITGNRVFAGNQTEFPNPQGTNHVLVIGNTDSCTVTGNYLYDTRLGASGIQNLGNNINLVLEAFHTPASQFQQAAAAGGLAGPNASPTATPFEDGVQNLLKYAFNMDMSGPDVGAHVRGTGQGGLPHIVSDPSGGSTRFLRFEFVRRIRSGLNYMPQISDSLLPLSWNPVTAPPVIQPINQDWERVVTEEPYNPATTSRLFGRVQVLLP